MAESGSSTAPIPVPAAAEGVAESMQVPHNTPVAHPPMTPANSIMVDEGGADRGGEGPEAGDDIAAAVQEKLEALKVGGGAGASAGEGEGGGDADAADGGEDEDEDEDEDEEGEYPPAVVAMKVLHVAQEKYLEDYQAERVALELKYNALMAPLHAKRAQVIRHGVVSSGVDEAGKPKEAWAEVAAAAASAGDEGGEGGAAADTSSTTGAAALAALDSIVVAAGDEGGVPNFWLTAMQNSELINETIEERDEKALVYLRDIRMIPHVDLTGYKLEFEFDDNPFFTNRVLTKTYDVPNMLDHADSPMLGNLQGTEIDWRPGQDLTVKLVTKKIKKKGGKRDGGRGGTRTVTREEDCKSFFNFFSPPDIEELQEGPEDEEDEDFEEKAALVDFDFEMGMTFKKAIVRDAVLWFTGEAAEEDDEAWEAGEEEDDDDDDGDDDDDDDDDGAPAAKPFSAKGGMFKDVPAGAAGEQECKQQ